MARKAEKKTARAKAAQAKKSAKRKTASAGSTAAKTTKKAAKGKKKTARKAVKKSVKKSAAATKTAKKKPAGKAAKTTKKAAKSKKKTARKAVKKSVKKSAAATKTAKKKPAGKAAKGTPRSKKKTVPARSTKSAQPASRKVPKRIVARRTISRAHAEAVAARKRAEAELAARMVAERQAAEKQTQHYTKAVGFFNNRKFSRALKWFEKAAEGPEPTLRHRAQVHARICAERVSATKLKLKTADDYYNYGIKLINDRELEQAGRCLEKALRLSADGDHIHYAASLVHALQGDAAAAVESLRRAIELNGRNRSLARTDADLSSLRDHPAWTELISPNAPSRPTV